jgi:hypothetical protein
LNPGLIRFGFSRVAVDEAEIRPLLRFFAARSGLDGSQKDQWGRDRQQQKDQDHHQTSHILTPFLDGYSLGTISRINPENAADYPSFDPGYPRKVAKNARFA